VGGRRKIVYSIQSSFRLPSKVVEVCIVCVCVCMCVCKTNTARNALLSRQIQLKYLLDDAQAGEVKAELQKGTHVLHLCHF